MNISLNEINFEEILFKSTFSTQKLTVSLENRFHRVNFMKCLRLLNSVCAPYTRVTLISPEAIIMEGKIDFGVCQNLETIILNVDQNQTYAKKAYYSFAGMPYLTSITLNESGDFIYFQTYSHIKISDTPLLASIKLNNACQIDKIDAPCLLSFEATACSVIKTLVAPKMNFFNVSNRSDKTIIQDNNLKSLCSKKTKITPDTVQHTQIITVLENFREARKKALKEIQKYD